MSFFSSSFLSDLVGERLVCRVDGVCHFRIISRWLNPSSLNQVKPGILPAISCQATQIVADCLTVRDGDDGPWSSFSIRVGNPAQNLRVLASTTVPETWVVLKTGCTDQDPSGCNLARGTLFNPNTSTTWQDQGSFGLGVEINLPYTGNYDNGDYGFDSLGFGLQSNGVTVNHSVIAAIATKDFFLGNLGLTPRPINFTQFDDPKTSLLTNLRNSNQIPSLTFGYSAGAKYRKKHPRTPRS